MKFTAITEKAARGVEGGEHYARFNEFQPAGQGKVATTDEKGDHVGSVVELHPPWGFDITSFKELSLVEVNASTDQTYQNEVFPGVKINRVIPGNTHLTVIAGLATNTFGLVVLHLIQEKGVDLSAFQVGKPLHLSIVSK